MPNTPRPYKLKVKSRAKEAPSGRSENTSGELSLLEMAMLAGDAAMKEVMEESRNGLDLTPEVVRSLLAEKPIYEKIAGRTLTLRQVHDILRDHEGEE